MRVALLLLVGCSSSSPVLAETNPVGQACPSTNIGHVPSSGTARFRAANLKFQGYRSQGTGVVSTGGAPTTIALCDYYNPTGTNGGYKLIHLSAVARWCGPCGLEASAISGYDYQTSARIGPGIAANLAPLGVVFIQAVVEGATPNVASNMADLKIWIDSHQGNFPEVVDPEAATLTDFLPVVETLPWNLDIDARSMEIVTTDTGYSSSLEDDLKKLVTQLPDPPMP